MLHKGRKTNVKTLGAVHQVWVWNLILLILGAVLKSHTSGIK